MELVNIKESHGPCFARSIEANEGSVIRKSEMTVILVKTKASSTPTRAETVLETIAHFDDSIQISPMEYWIAVSPAIPFEVLRSHVHR
jgi:hypothetical protein